MIRIEDKSKCTGCGACYCACPKSCINMIADEEGYYYPKVSENDCIHCNVCNNVCPVQKNETQLMSKHVVFAAIHKNQQIRMNSSSGGVYSSLCKCVINKGGVVWGAAYIDYFFVSHIEIDSLDQIERVRGTKYIQSRTEDAFKKIKEQLDDNRIVLYSGTPCQVEGLLSFLGKRYENLFTQDLVCHGVPSELMWHHYIEKYGVPQNVSFRDKSTGWKNYSMIINFVDRRIKDLHYDNPYMKAYLSNYTLRPSCYSCKFRKEFRRSDITLADCWGVWDLFPELNDDKGVSTIIIHSEKGQKLIDDASNELLLTPISMDFVIERNSSYIKSPLKPENRDMVIEQLLSYDFENVVKNTIRQSTTDRLKKSIKSWLKKWRS